MERFIIETDIELVTEAGKRADRDLSHALSENAETFAEMACHNLRLNDTSIPKIIRVACRRQLNDKPVKDRFEQRLRWPAG